MGHGFQFAKCKKLPKSLSPNIFFVIAYVTHIYIYISHINYPMLELKHVWGPVWGLRKCASLHLDDSDLEMCFILVVAILRPSK